MGVTAYTPFPLMYYYTLESLQNNSLTELKQIASEVGVLPSGDKRCRQNWIDALVNTQPPLLKLLEVSPGVETDPGVETFPGVETDSVFEAIAPAAKTFPGVETDSVFEAIASKFGRIVYPKPTINAIAPAATFNDEQPPNRGDGREHQLETDQKLSQSAIAPAAKASPGVETDSVFEAIARIPKPSFVVGEEQFPADLIGGEHCEKCLVCGSLWQLYPRWNDAGTYFHGFWEVACGYCENYAICDLPACFGHDDDDDDDDAEVRSPAGITFSAKFLATYTPYFGAAHKIEPTGQLNLLELVETIEPPDPDDFDSMFAFWAAYDAWDKATETKQEQEGFSPFLPLETSFDTRTNLASEPTPRPLQVSLESFSQWAAIPDSWYELQLSEVLELSSGSKSSNTCEFLIPVFDPWCDRQNGPDEPPDTGKFARLPRPKPPNFPPTSVIASDRANDIDKFARHSTLADGRAPPGGDARQM